MRSRGAKVVGTFSNKLAPKIGSMLPTEVAAKRWNSLGVSAPGASGGSSGAGGCFESLSSLNWFGAEDRLDDEEPVRELGIRGSAGSDLSVWHSGIRLPDGPLHFSAAFWSSSID